MHIFCKKKYCCTGIQKYCPFNQVIHEKGTDREGGVVLINGVMDIIITGSVYPR